LIAVGSSLGGFATVMVALVGWFNRHRSKAVAISQMGNSIGGIGVPIVVLCLEAFGWRTTALLSGIVILLVGLPAVQIMKHRPAEIGETVDGATGTVESGTALKPIFDERRDFTAREAMRTRAFWLISIGHGFALLAVSAITVHLVPHLTGDLHYSLANAGLVVALMTTFQMLGQVSGGYLGDKLDKRMISTSCMVAHGLGLLIVAYASNIWMVVAFSVLHGLAWGIRGPMMVALRADYFGPSSFGTIMGFSSMIIMIGMSTGPVLAGYLADIYGNYKMGFTVLAFAAFLGSFCFLAATAPTPRASSAS
jgi:MFS family permease